MEDLKPRIEKVIEKFNIDEKRKKFGKSRQKVPIPIFGKTTRMQLLK